MLAQLKVIWIYVRAKFPVNRVVSMLTPPLTIAAGLASAWIAENVPFLADYGLNEEFIVGFGLAGAGAALLALRQWIDGKLKWDIATHRQVLANDPLDLAGVPADRHLPETTAEEDLARAVKDKPKPRAKAPAKK